MKNKTNKKPLVILALVALLVVGGVMGTVAWLTATDTVTNTFTVVGDIEEPTVDPEIIPDPANPYDPAVDAYLWEPSWDDAEDHKLLPGSTIAKDPYVGVGAKSEESVVYVYVHNNLSNKVYFTLNDGWEAVDGQTTEGYAAGTYTSGLFKYTATLAPSADADAWTTNALFSEVVVDDSADTSDIDVTDDRTELTIEVGSYIHQAKDGEGNAVVVAADDIVTAIKTEMGIA